ncbi:MAG: hypothetical protein ABIR68_05695 [Ilumatobacteraceae bacterium]
MGATAGRVVFTVVVLAIFIGAIVYTALCARVIVEREGAEAELEQELANVVNTAAARLHAEQTSAARAADTATAPSAHVVTQG